MSSIDIHNGIVALSRQTGNSQIVTWPAFTIVQCHKPEQNIEYWTLTRKYLSIHDTKEVAAPSLNDDR